jgi:hypothetical protein
LQNFLNHRIIVKWVQFPAAAAAVAVNLLSIFKLLKYEKGRDRETYTDKGQNMNE